MGNLSAVVTISDAAAAAESGTVAVDQELRVAGLQELYDTCRDAPPSKVMRIALKGPDGEVRLNFASFIRKE